MVYNLDPCIIGVNFIDNFALKEFELGNLLVELLLCVVNVLLQKEDVAFLLLHVHAFPFRHDVLGRGFQHVIAEFGERGVDFPVRLCVLGLGGACAFQEFELLLDLLLFPLLLLPFELGAFKLRVELRFHLEFLRHLFYFLVLHLDYHVFLRHLIRLLRNVCIYFLVQLH